MSRRSDSGSNLSKSAQPALSLVRGEAPANVLVGRGLVGTPDEAPFAAVYARCYGPLISFALRFVRDEDAAADLVQDVFIDVWHDYLEQLTEGDAAPVNLDPLLYRRLHSAVVGELRRRDRERLRAVAFCAELVDRVRDWMESGSRADEGDVVGALERAVRGLPRKTREAYVLVAEHDMSYTDAAKVLGKSKDTVRLQYLKAHRLLRSALEEAGFAPGPDGRSYRGRRKKRT
jgi:RNA polymerase sigma factor (sigma-70 family)